jgi:hypothetical protein
MAHLRPRVQTGFVPRPGVLAKPTTPPARPEDPFLAKVIKYIPAETIAAYQAAIGFVPESAQSSVVPYFALFLVIFTPLWVLVATKEATESWAWYQALAAMVAFLVWLFAIASPAWPWVVDAVNGAGAAVQAAPGYIRSLVLLASSLLFPLVEKGLQRLGFGI